MSGARRLMPQPPFCRLSTLAIFRQSSILRNVIYAWPRRSPGPRTPRRSVIKTMRKIGRVDLAMKELR